MSPKTFVVLSILTAAALVAAAAAPGRNQGYQPVAGAGDRVFPNLIDRVNDVATVEIEHANGRVTLVNGDAGWTMKERDGYAARQVRVRRAILGLAELRFWEPKTRLKEKYPKLELRDPDAKDARSKRIKLFDRGGALLADLIVGKRRRGLAGTTTGGVYVRKPGDAQTWLAAGITDITKERTNWLERKIVDIEVSRVKNVVIRHPGGGTVTISKPDPKAGDFNLDGIPPGKKLIAPSDLSGIARALADLQLDDVEKDTGGFDSDTATATEYLTFDGLFVQVRIIKRDGAYWLRLEATGEAADAITARTAGWAYKISDFAASNLTKRLKDLIEDAKAGS